MNVHVYVCECVCEMAYDFIAGGETHRRVKSALSLCQRGGTGAKSGVNQRTLRHPENSE